MVFVKLPGLGIQNLTKPCQILALKEKVKDSILIVGVYVDDLVIAGDDSKEIDDLKK